MKWDSLQQAVIDEVTNGSGNLVILARAGAGKTGVLVECAHRLERRGSILMCAFNTEIQKELERRAPSWATVRTLHSIGFETVRQVARDVNVDKWKTWSDARYVCRAATRQGGRARHGIVYVNEIVKLVGLCKNVLPSCEEDVMKLARQHKLLSAEGERDLGYAAFVQLAIATLQLAPKDLKKISFDDMLYLPAKLGLTPRTYDYIFVDETQDLNAAQIDLILKMRNPLARIIAVGDPRQAIYRWRGADMEALDKFKTGLSAKTLPMSVTYRCSKRVVEHVRQALHGKVNDLVPRTGAPDGLVAEVSIADFESAFGPIMGDFVLARTNKELMAAYKMLIRRRIPAAIAGKDLGKGLISLVEGTHAQTIDEMHRTLARNFDDAQKAADDPEAQEALVELQDQIDAIGVLAENHTRVFNLIQDLEMIFDNDDAAVLESKNQVVITTIHKAKGRERDRVWLMLDGFPRKKSGALLNEEEYNVYYVGATRARENLFLVSGTHTKNCFDI
jgi:DNA helicase-2/ATP-dependent DNA helicase PcrA